MRNLARAAWCWISLLAACALAAGAAAEPSVAFQGSVTLIDTEGPVDWRAINDPQFSDASVLEIESGAGLIRIPLEGALLDAFAGSSHGLNYLALTVQRKDEDSADAAAQVLFVAGEQASAMLAAGGQILLSGRTHPLERQGGLALLRLELAELERLK